MNVDLQIRLATSDDVSAMASAYVEAFLSVDPSELWNQSAAEALVRFLLRAQPDLSFVAIMEGAIVGGISGMAKPWWDGCHLVQTELFLTPSAQRRKVGSALFYQFLAEAHHRYNASVIESITFRDLEFPASWYEALGFEDKESWKVIFGDVKMLCERLKAKISRPHQ